MPLPPSLGAHRTGLVRFTAVALTRPLGLARRGVSWTLSNGLIRSMLSEDPSGPLEVGIGLPEVIPQWVALGLVRKLRATLCLILKF